MAVRCSTWNIYPMTHIYRAREYQWEHAEDLRLKYKIGEFDTSTNMQTTREFDGHGVAKEDQWFMFRTGFAFARSFYTPEALYELRIENPDRESFIRTGRRALQPRMP